MACRSGVTKNIRALLQSRFGPQAVLDVSRDSPWAYRVLDPLPRYRGYEDEGIRYATGMSGVMNYCGLTLIILERRKIVFVTFVNRFETKMT
ncbi:hypothetical protein TNCV_2908091 [Trichonephila clavipes]|nr:hypothetical protein TNCV_2908091 [Trichonephila clavipes]